MLDVDEGGLAFEVRYFCRRGGSPKFLVSRCDDILDSVEHDEFVLVHRFFLKRVFNFSEAGVVGVKLLGLPGFFFHQFFLRLRELLGEHCN